jgi:hypothetical protein
VAEEARRADAQALEVLGLVDLLRNQPPICAPVLPQGICTTPKRA